MTLRYASHLGYRSAETPLFLRSVGSTDAVAHIDHAAALGFQGVQYALAASRPSAEQARVATRIRDLNLEAGCVVYASFDDIRRLRPGAPDRHSGEAFLEKVRCGLDTAQVVGSRHLAVFAPALDGIDLDLQRQVFGERLSEAAAWAERCGVTIGLEPLSSPLLPVMILRTLDEALGVIKHCGAPNVKLLFDTAHVQAMEGDAAAQFRRVYEQVDVLQLADVPNRWEPGSGFVDFANILDEATRRGFPGLVELEHGWSRDDARLERDTAERLLRGHATERGSQVGIDAGA